MGAMIVTWIPAVESPTKRHDSQGPFETDGVDPANGRVWSIHVFNGEIQCTSYERGVLDHSVVAAFRLYTPRNIVNPSPAAPKTDIDRRPQQVATVSGSWMRLERGHAVSVVCGAGNLHVSWDYPEYGHPK